MARILVIDRSASVRLAARRSLESRGHRCVVLDGLAAARVKIEELDAELVLLDRSLVGGQSSAEIRKQLGLSPGASLLIWADRAELDERRQPASDPHAQWIRRPSEFSELEELLRTALERPADVALAPAERLPAEGELLWCSEAMRRVQERIVQLAPHDIPVLIEGESGTGKELVAHALHRGGPHPEEPFVAIHCGAIPSELLESELFGFERGSFTDAHRSRRGRFELAGRGTLLLDEIGEMPLELQAKLLRVLQDRRIERVGGRGSTTLQARILAATNRDLLSMTEAGSFRRDLFYRLAVASILVPPLRERPEDLRLLLQAMLARLSLEYGKNILGLDQLALDALLAHSWPGNVRELENTLRRAVVLARSNVLGLEALELVLPPQPSVADSNQPEQPAETHHGWRQLLEKDLLRRLQRGESPEGLEAELTGAFRQMIERARRDSALGAGGAKSNQKIPKNRPASSDDPIGPDSS